MTLEDGGVMPREYAFAIRQGRQETELRSSDDVVEFSSNAAAALCYHALIVGGNTSCFVVEQINPAKVICVVFGDV